VPEGIEKLEVTNAADLEPDPQEDPDETTEP
jgi:hypothetical protein